MKPNAVGESCVNPELKNKRVCVWVFMTFWDNKGHSNKDGILDNMTGVVLTFLRVVMVRNLGLEQGWVATI